MRTAKRFTPKSEPNIEPNRIKISSRTLENFKYNSAKKSAKNQYAAYEPPAGVLPPKTTGHGIAMDAGFDCNANWGMGFGDQFNNIFQEGYAFPGFQILAQWSQIIEYRRPCEVYAREMSRKWIKFIAKGDDDKSDKIAKIENEFKRLNVQSVFRKAIEQDALFGRSHIFFDMGDIEGSELSKPLVETKAKIGKNGLKCLTVVEPFWIYPNQYDANNPLNPTFYKPVSWYCMGKEVHSSRMCTLVTRPLPDILKPAYAFAGLSLQQVMKPYIDNWLRTRQNVSDLINAFNVWTLSTDMNQITMDDGANSLLTRLQLFNMARDNHGVNAIDKETEEFASVSANLGTLDKLQAQAQEHMCAPSGLPLVYLTGITPAGLNASSQDEIEIFQDTVAANQEIITPHVNKVLNIVMLSLFGDIDEDISFEWEKMKVVPEKELAEIRKMEAETDIAYTDAGILAPDEVRSGLATEEDSRYPGLDLDRVIKKPEDPSEDPEMKDFHESIGGSSD